MTMTVQDFTEAELETLRRFQDAPLIRERYDWDQRPLVPSGVIQYAHDLVPIPDTGPVTAAELSRYYLADSIGQGALGRHLMRRNDLKTADVASIHEMNEAYHQAATSFLVGFLLRHVSDEVATEGWAILDGGEIGEWSWPWLEDDGVDPHLIKTPPTRTEALEEGARRLAEHRARRATA